MFFLRAQTWSVNAAVVPQSEADTDSPASRETLRSLTTGAELGRAWEGPAV